MANLEQELRCLSSYILVLSPAERESLEINLGKDACYVALSSMKPQKSPGSDELPADFYQFFWSTLGSDLVEVLNHSLSSGLFSKS